MAKDPLPSRLLRLLPTAHSAPLSLAAVAEREGLRLALDPGDQNSSTDMLSVNTYF